MYEDRKSKQKLGIRKSFENGMPEGKRKSISRHAAFSSIENHEIRNGRKDDSPPMDGIGIE